MLARPRAKQEPSVSFSSKALGSICSLVRYFLALTFFSLFFYPPHSPAFHPIGAPLCHQEPNPYNVAPNTVYYVLTAENAG